MQSQSLFNPKSERLIRLLGKAERPRLLVIGDVMLDHFIFGDAERISPEAPVPVVNMEKESWILGGAANVAHNLSALNADVTLFGLVGQDETAWRLRSIAHDTGIDVSLFADADRPTTIKIRILARGQQMLRVDNESRSKIGAELTTVVMERLKALPPLNVVLVSDYAKGFITHELMQAVLHAARRMNAPVLVDPKPANADCYKGAYLVTPNLKEAEEMSGIRITDIASAQRAGRLIQDKLQVGAVLVTMGAKGMVLYVKEDRWIHLPTMAREVFDVTGAGDTVIAVLAWALAQGAEMEEAAYLANVAAGIVVAKVGTATISIQELAQTL
ncbi:MAG: D-glycero-beta-D-manno-heptose-7-phosphate kinase [Dissulfuribacterales bacterium]